MTEAPFLHIAAYKFTPLINLPDLRRDFYDQTLALGLKGTILLAEEGMNLMVAGGSENIRDFQKALKQYPPFSDLTFKESVCSEPPFNRLLVKIKKQIIPLGRQETLLKDRLAPRIAPRALKQWLDQNRDITLLDARNLYEIRLGTFNKALHLNINHFRDFVARAKELPLALKQKPLVTFCTGGIRCEKAVPHLLDLGFKEVYQLDGGILQYFKECGNAHYSGECFVFDRRVALDESLHETGTAQCFHCLAPVTIEEQLLPTYIPDISCPHCV